MAAKQTSSVFLWISRHIALLVYSCSVDLRLENMEHAIMQNTEDFPILTTELAIEILTKTLEKLQNPENTQKLDEARDNVGNEMLKMMQFLFPIVMQIQMDVITEFGFPEGRESIVKFAQMLRSLEADNAEVAQLHSVVRSYYLPPVAVNASPPEERLNCS